MTWRTRAREALLLCGLAGAAGALVWSTMLLTKSEPAMWLAVAAAAVGVVLGAVKVARLYGETDRIPAYVAVEVLLWPLAMFAVGIVVVTLTLDPPPGW